MKKKPKIDSVNLIVIVAIISITLASALFYNDGFASISGGAVKGAEIELKITCEQKCENLEYPAGGKNVGSTINSLGKKLCLDQYTKIEGDFKDFGADDFCCCKLK